MRTDKPDGLLRVLRHRDFRLLMIAFTTSFAGSWAYNVALMGYVWEATRSPVWLGAVTIGRFVPSLLLGAYGGVLADRFERVRLMISIDVASAALMIGLAVLAAVGGHPALAIVLAAVCSVLGMTYEPATAALTPQTVPERELAAANTIRNTVDNIAIIAGPAIGGLLLLLGSPALVFAINAGTFLVSALITGRMTVRSQPVDVTEGGASNPLRQMLVGVQAIASSQTATVLCAFSVIASFVYGVDTVQLIVLSDERLGTGADGYGYLLAGLGVGGLAAAGLVNRISALPRLGTAILAGMAVYCLPTLFFLVVESPVAAFAIEVVRGGGTIIVDVLAVTALQRSLPADKLGRVFGAFFTFVLAAISLGAFVTPLALAATSLDATLWMAGLGIPVLCLLGLPVLRRMDNANVATVAALEPRIAVLQRAAILAEASRPVLERLASNAEEITVDAGTDVVREGQDADAFYVIESGSMAVRSRGGEAMERELPSMAEGQYFGEIGLLRRIPRTATVTAREPSTLLKITAEDFLEALTTGSASVSMLEGARTRLARTPTYAVDAEPRDLLPD
ncbi:MFS transporter [Intrasporangium sp.]|uniref:MFS transporter n=1 Tax=Intrasporangium sp. TaxID=1925024 RepID=UPI00293B6282|nr:MFS transporter [Intrasporangium sp.]MDV3219899.1 MFS transporter [Intrasporangium sp.]